MTELSDPGSQRWRTSEGLKSCVTAVEATGTDLRPCYFQRLRLIGVRAGTEHFNLDDLVQGDIAGMIRIDAQRIFASTSMPLITRPNTV